MLRAASGVTGICLALFASAPQDDRPGVRVWGVVESSPGAAAKDAVVYLESPLLKPPSPGPRAAVLDQRNLTFVPRVLPIVQGTTVSFPNSDSVRHNVFSASETQMFNLGTYPPGLSPSMKFQQAGVVEILCNVHPEMTAFILVLKTSYFAKTDDRGAFEIPDVPAGAYQIVFWCEHQGTVSRSVELTGQEVSVRATLHQNRIEVSGRDLGEATKK